MEILNSSQMGEADRYTIEEIGIPSIVLMENAASTVVDEIMTRVEVSSAVVVVGAGNNGGDGLAIARLLNNIGVRVEVLLTCPESKLKGDALTNYEILKNFPVFIYKMLTTDIPSFEDYDIVVDAIFGTGLSRPLEGFYEDLVESINTTSNCVVSVDIPSGLSGDSNNVIGRCVNADFTVTFARPKFPHALYPARDFCGEVIVTDISIPDFAVSTVGCKTYLLESGNLPIVEQRASDSHKGNFGHSVLIGGSEGKSGAVFMASRACARIGSGLTTTALPSKLMMVAESVNPEIMSLGIGSKSHFEENGIKKLTDFLKDKTIAAVGMGIGTEEATGAFLNKLIEGTDIPLIIDADGINLLNDDILAKLKNRCAITPHIGEFAKLTGKNKEKVLENRIELASNYAKEKEIVLVLKSADTIIALPDGSAYVDTTGTPALAKGGSGDCLTGLIAGFAAQGYALDEACMLGSYTLGRTAEILDEEINAKSLLTSDIIENLWKTLDELEEDA